MVILLPFTSSFALLATGRLVQYLALGAFVTADASLIVYLIGTAACLHYHSPPEFDSLTLLHYACAGLQFRDGVPYWHGS